MNQQIPKRRRFLRVLLVLVVLLGGAAGAGWLYLSAAGSPAVASDDASRKADDSAGAATKDKDKDAGKKADDGKAASGEASKSESAPEKAGDDEGKDKKKDEAIPVSVAEIRTGTVSSYISATANLVAENEVKILAESEGRVDRLLVEEGDRVKAESLLASLNREDAQIQFDKAQVKEDTARTAWERASRMAEQKLISPEDFDATTRDHLVAKQELAEARWNLEKTEVRAPFAGRVTQRMVTVGQHVKPGDELFTLTDFDPLIARIYLPEKDVIGLTKNRDVRITLKADETVRFQGRIRQISPVVDTTTGTVKVTIEAVNPPSEVRPGGFVTVDIVKETRPKVVVLPREAVIRELQRAHVFVVKSDDVAEKRSVDLGLEEGDHIEIRSGVAPGEQVVVAGQGSLKNGSKVKIIPVATAEDASAGSRKVRPARG